MTLQQEIESYKRGLLKRASKRGIYEGFGQAEARKLYDKYGAFQMDIVRFEEWCEEVEI